jgi:hypothetical protein
MKNFVLALMAISVLFIQGCATTGADLGAFKPARTLSAAQTSIEKTAQNYMTLADMQQDKLDNSYNRNFLLSAVAAGSAISSLHVSVIKGLAFLSGTSAIYSEQAPNAKRAEALLAGASTLQCMLQKTHEAGYGLPPTESNTQTTRDGDMIAARSVQLKQTQKTIADRINLYADSRRLMSESFKTSSAAKDVNKLNSAVQALAIKVDLDINPTASDAAVTAALNDGAEFVERQVRERFLTNSKFDYKKIFADLKALADVSAEKDDAAEAEAAINDLPSGSGKIARKTAKLDPSRTVLKDIATCREKLL